MCLGANLRDLRGLGAENIVSTTILVGLCKVQQTDKFYTFSDQNFQESMLITRIKAIQKLLQAVRTMPLNQKLTA